MRNIALGTVLLMTGFSAIAASPADKTDNSSDSAWVEVVRTHSDIFGVKKGSFEVGQTKGGVPIAVVLGQVTNIKSTQITYRKWYVTKEHCLSGLGKLVHLDTNGDYVSEVDFVMDGDSAASEIASIVCIIYKSELEEEQSKGI